MHPDFNTPGIGLILMAVIIGFIVIGVELHLIIGLLERLASREDES